MIKNKNSKPSEDNSPDFLVKKKTQFEKEITERINLGEELLSTLVKDKDQMIAVTGKYDYWHDFNKEFLKRAFNKTNNQYYKEYVYFPSISFGSAIQRTPTFNEMVVTLQTNISKYLTRLKKIKEKSVLIDEIPGLSPVNSNDDTDVAITALKYLDKLFSRFHKVSQNLRHRHSDRETLTIKDEYDVQDLLRSLLQIYYNDIREEDYCPSYAGSNSRVDFVLKEEKIVIETKMTNDNLKDKEIGSQLSIDIARYRAHPDCKVLVVFVYDKGDFIRNKSAIKNDLERLSSTDLKVKIYIEPQ